MRRFAAGSLPKTATACGVVARLLDSARYGDSADSFDVGVTMMYRSPRRRARLATLVAAVMVLAACGPAAMPGQPAASGQPREAATRAPSRPLVALVRLEPPSLISRGLVRQVSMHLARR